MYCSSLLPVTTLRYADHAVTDKVYTTTVANWGRALLWYPGATTTQEGPTTQTGQSGLAELAFGFMISSTTRSSWERKSRRGLSLISHFLVQKYFSDVK